MTDLVTFLDMLCRAGIEWTDYDDYDGEFPAKTGQPGDTVICVAPYRYGERNRLEPDKEDWPVTGYVMSRTDFAFAPDGSLRQIGCWE